MASLALFIQQCLTEEKYGTQFISEIEQRLESLNYTQLVKMHEVLIKASKAAKMKVWKEGNDNIIQYVEKWLEIRKKEHDIIMKREEEVLRRIRHKQKIKELNEREKIRVIQQLKEKARHTAEHEIKTLEVQRKAAYKQTLFEVVDRAEKRRNYHIIFGLLFFIIGCVICGLFIKDLIIVLSIIGGIFVITLFIFYRAYRVSQVAPYDDHPDTIEKQIQIRERELFNESMDLIHQHEREYEEKMLEDKLERKKRKREKKRHEEVLQYLENHPEIVIEDPTGDIEAQLMEALRKKDPSFRHDNSNNHDNEDEKDNDDGDDDDSDNDGGIDIEQNKKQENMFKSDNKMNVIFEESGDENDLSSRKDESGKLSSKKIDSIKKNSLSQITIDNNNNHNHNHNNSNQNDSNNDIGMLIAPGKDSNETPETTNNNNNSSWKQRKQSNSSKYLTHESYDVNDNNEQVDDKNDEYEREFDIEEGGGKTGVNNSSKITNKKSLTIIKSNLKITQISLSDFLSSFIENSFDYTDIYMTLSIQYSINSPSLIERKDSTQIDDKNSSPTSLLLSYQNQLYQTDSQKCVGEIITWRVTTSPPPTPSTNITITSPNQFGNEINQLENNPSKQLYLIDLPSPNSSILLTLIFKLYSIRPTNTLLATGMMTSDELIPLIKPKTQKQQSFTIPLIRNEIIKVCNLKFNCKITQK